MASKTLSCADIGTHNVMLKVTDAAGNTAAKIAQVLIKDITAPVITPNGDITVNADAGGCTYASAQLTKPVAADNCSTVTVVASPASLVSGANTVTWTVTDAAGLTATSTQKVTVKDAQKPVVFTKNISVTLDAFGKASITVDQINNGSTDNCGIA